jgi:hypothetical protein
LGREKFLERWGEICHGGQQQWPVTATNGEEETGPLDGLVGVRRDKRPSTDDCRSIGGPGNGICTKVFIRFIGRLHHIKTCPSKEHSFRV